MAVKSKGKKKAFSSKSKPKAKKTPPKAAKEEASTRQSELAPALEPEILDPEEELEPNGARRKQSVGDGLDFEPPDDQDDSEGTPGLVPLGSGPPATTSALQRYLWEAPPVSSVDPGRGAGADPGLL